MLSAGYISRVPDPEDGRKAKLSITPTGRALHEQIVKILVARETEVLDVLNDSERQQLQTLIQKVALHAATLKK